MFRARIALAVLVLGSLGLGASCNRTSTATSSTVPSPDVRNEPQQPAPSANAVTQVSGVDLAALSQAERELFWAVANDELSPCGDPHSLAVCARDRTCATCLPAMRFLARRVQDGFPREQLGELVRARYARSAVQTIHIEGAPSRGPATAPVTIVEFSDYECPHCGRAAPILRDIEREFHDRVRVVHMHFPLSGHIHAMPASRAAVAAGRQGKFWEFHDLLFANQTALEQADLERYATQVGLDLNRFRADMQSPETEARVAADRREGERLQIDGTPTIFINGRRYVLPLERSQLREWVQEEIDAPTTR
jgi:2-hydroxychromene-2-carboxylate isomerase